MELEHLGGGAGKPEKSNTRLYKIALAICVCLCAVLLLALIVGKTHTHTHTALKITYRRHWCGQGPMWGLF